MSGKNPKGLKGVELIAPDVQAVGTRNGSSIDRRGFDFLMALACFGTPAAGATAVFKVQHANPDASNPAIADSGDWADLLSATLGGSNDAALAQQTTASGLKRLDVNLQPAKAFIRGVLVVGVDTFDVGVTGVLLGAQKEPAQTPDVEAGVI